LANLANQITFLSTLIFILGFSALYKGEDSGLKNASIIVFTACIINFISFSDFSSLSVEGQAVGLLIIFVIILHLTVQKTLRSVYD
jgi:hypothetical protein